MSIPILCLKHQVTENDKNDDNNIKINKLNNTIQSYAFCVFVLFK